MLRRRPSITGPASTLAPGGWIIGGLLLATGHHREGAFTDHWTARVEYLFVDLQNSTFTPVVGTNVNVKFNANLIRLGVDYKF